MEITREMVWKELNNVIDPEMMLSITDLGLVYDIEVGADKITVDFTLTYPGCPAADMIEEDIVFCLKSAFGLEVKTNIVREPRWTPEMMSEELRVGFGYPV